MTVSVQAYSTPESIPEFLCPNFGFFSRSLFSFSPLPSPPPPPIPPPTTPFRARARTVGHVWTGIASNRRTWGAVGGVKCACGRLPHSCLRCRATSSSAGPASVVAEGILEEAVDPPVELPEPPAPVRARQRSPETTTLSPSSIHRRPLHQAIVASAKVIESFGKAHRPHSLVGLTDLDDLRLQVRRVRKAVLYLWSSALDPVDPKGKSIKLDDITQLRIFDSLVRLSQLLIRFVPVPPSSSPEDRLQLGVSQHHLNVLHRGIGDSIATLLEVLPVGVTDPQDPFHRFVAFLRVTAVSLQNPLPPIPTSPIPSLPTAPSRFESDLVAIFRPKIDRDASASTEPERWTSITKIQNRTVAALLSSWESSSTGAEEALKFIAGWEINDRTGLDDSKRYGRLLGRLAPSPSLWLDESAPTFDLEPKEAALHLITYLSTSGSSLEALRIFDLLERRNIKLNEVSQIEALTLLLDGLTRDKFYEDVNLVVDRLTALIEPLERSADGLPEGEWRPLVFEAYRMMVKAAAGQGRKSRVAELLSKLEGLDPLEATARRMKAASIASDIEEVTRLFDAVDKTQAAPWAQERLYGQLVTAYVHVDDLESGMKALISMVRDGLQPHLALVNSLISGYAARLDIDRTYTLFNRIPELSLSPNLVTYSALISLHSNLRDPESGERVIEEMLSVGIAPDLEAWTTLMNSYVEVGNFTRALEIYSFLDSQPDVSLKPDTATVNVVLKAAVLAATPAQTVLALFRQTLDRGLRPNAHTYTTLMHSLCTAGLMDVAEELFRMMDKPAEQSSLPLSMQLIKPNAFIFSTMISGYLQQNETNKARAALTEMRARGIKVSSVTYGIIVSSFLRPEMGEKGLELASSIARNFLSTTPPVPLRHSVPTSFDRSFVQGKAILNVVGPLIVAYARRMQANQAVELFGQIVDLDSGPPSVVIYSALMDAYRRVGELEDVLELWRRLSFRVLNFYGKPSSDEVRKILPSHSTVLCIPLTIVLDSLAQHDDTQLQVVRIWDQLTLEGYQFDASNWNSLAVAACKHNQIRRAFWIAENVLCRGEDELLEPSSLSIDFGPTPRVDSIPRTPSRLFQHRSAERHLQRKQPGSIADLLSRPTETDAEFEPTILEAQRVRRGMYWFPHAALLQQLDKRFMELPREEEEEGEELEGREMGLREELKRTCPRTIDALGRWKVRLERARMDEGGRGFY